MNRLAALLAVAALAACEVPPERRAEIDREAERMERTMLLTSSEWGYETPAGDSTAENATRCAVRWYRGRGVSDVACGRLVAWIESGSDPAEVRQLLEAAGAELADEPAGGLAFLLGRPDPELPLRVTPGTEAVAIQVLAGSRIVRGVDVVDEVARQ